MVPAPKMILARRFRFLPLVFFWILPVAAPSPGQLASPGSSAGQTFEPPAIIFGFVGGFVRHDDAAHDEVRLAARLRQEYATGVVVETFENHDGEHAHERILTLLNPNHDRILSAEDKSRARIVLYGHSWGATEVVTLARRLEKDGIPVLLTIQVDSISKLGQNDQAIPANVAQAANFYQTDGLLRGEPKILAADAARTQIIGNFRFRYAGRTYACVGYPWYTRIFMKAHTQIECDPEVWGQVESLIRAALPSTAQDRSSQ
jgi:hypothetical protein